MRIGIVQNSPTFGERERNLEAAFALVGGETADLWVFPELFATGYQFADAEEARAHAEPVPGGPTSVALAAFAADRGCYVVAGLPEEDGDGIYNAAVLVGPKGGVAVYRKLHLFYREKLHFRAGNRPLPVIDVGAARIGIMVCFDHLFPEAARTLALQGADIIAHPSNLVMPDLAQRTMAVRALENGVFAATANRIGTEARTSERLVYTGRSQIVAPDGERLLGLSEDRPEVGVADIDIAQARDKRITATNDKLADRRPDRYRLENSAEEER